MWKKTINHSKSGFTIITALVISIVLFSLLSLATIMNYRLHDQNRRMMKELQERLDSNHLITSYQHQPGQ